MSADVTNNLKIDLLSLLKDEIDNSLTLQAAGVNAPTYYIGFARSEPVTAEDNITDDNVASYQNQLRLRHTLHSVKAISNTSFVIPTVTWEFGQIYEPFDNTNQDQTNFYVINSLREVFLCVQQPKLSDGAPQIAFIEPRAENSSPANQAKTFQTNDGYVWRYLYKMSNLAYNLFRTKTYTPVKKITNANTTIPEEIEQLQLQDSSVSGQILSIAIDSAGINYSNPTINIQGDGVGASFSADVFDTRIVNVRLDSNGLGQFLHGNEYRYANVTVTDPGGGTGASLRAIIGPENGVNEDLLESLKTKSLMLQVDVLGDEQESIIAENQFYQVALFKGLKSYDSDNFFSGNTGNALKKLRLSSVTGSWIENDRFNNVLETAFAKIFYLDNDLLYYYQDEETGFASFSVDDDIINEKDGTADVINIENPDIDPYSGEILYINTLDEAITREPNQTEDVRIVIELG